jgi:hypothetical protein
MAKYEPIFLSGNGGYPRSTLRDRVAALQKENKEYKHKVDVLTKLVEGLCETVSIAVVTIEGHEHDDKELMLLEADLTELISMANDEVSSLS